MVLFNEKNKKTNSTTPYIYTRIPKVLKCIKKILDIIEKENIKINNILLENLKNLSKNLEIIKSKDSTVQLRSSRKDAFNGCLKRCLLGEGNNK